MLCITRSSFTCLSQRSRWHQVPSLNGHDATFSRHWESATKPQRNRPSELPLWFLDTRDLNCTLHNTNWKGATLQLWASGLWAAAPHDSCRCLCDQEIKRTQPVHKSIRQHAGKSGPFRDKDPSYRFGGGLAGGESLVSISAGTVFHRQPLRGTLPLFFCHLSLGG